MTSHPVKRRKKLIEVAIPLEAINAASARKKSIRHGHPSTLHLWRARRPLAAARALIFCQMVDDPSAVPEEFPTDVLPISSECSVPRPRCGCSEPPGAGGSFASGFLLPAMGGAWAAWQEQVPCTAISGEPDDRNATSIHAQQHFAAKRTSRCDQSPAPQQAADSDHPRL